MAPVPMISARPAVITGEDGVVRAAVLVLGQDGQQLLNLDADHIANFLISVRISAIRAIQTRDQLAAASPTDRALLQAPAEGRA